MKLKPCPFCGSQPCEIRYYSRRQVACMSSRCEVRPSTGWTGLKFARNAWNRRADSPPEGGKA